MLKPRSDSRLFHLSEENQAQVYDWIITFGYHKTKDRLAEPPPVGFGLATHINSLQRFFLRSSGSDRDFKPFLLPIERSHDLIAERQIE